MLTEMYNIGDQSVPKNEYCICDETRLGYRDGKHNLRCSSCYRLLKRAPENTAPVAKPEGNPFKVGETARYFKSIINTDNEVKSYSNVDAITDIKGDSVYLFGCNEWVHYKQCEAITS